VKGEKIAMTMGERLRNLRVKARNTLQDQSEIFEVSMNTIYRWEHNLAVPRKSKLKRIADHYSVPIEWLLSDSASAALVSETEQKLLSMFRNLVEGNQFKILGYVERICIEQLGVED
jgi:transcriptional regulator with XRE-family HTH domain